MMFGTVKSIICIYFSHSTYYYSIIVDIKYLIARLLLIYWKLLDCCQYMFITRLLSI